MFYKISFYSVVLLLLVGTFIFITGCSKEVSGNHNYITITANNINSLAISAGGDLWSWGSNYDGQIGDGTFDGKPRPTFIGSNFTHVDAGNDYVLAVKADGTLWAWGKNTTGQLGDGTLIDQSTPIQVGTNFSSVEAGGDDGGIYFGGLTCHSLGLKSDGSLWAWGSNLYGQLGDGTNVDRHLPIQIGTGYKCISAGSSHSLGIKTDGSLWAWGAIHLISGDSTIHNQNIPIQIGSDFAAISASDGYTLVLKSNGTLWAWGNNTYGQLGDGTNVTKTTLVKIGENYKAIATSDGNTAGAYGSFPFGHSLAIKNDGTLWTWGLNIDSQLGDGTDITKNIPVRIGSGYVDVSAGRSHSLAIRTDNSLWAWGDNLFGQLGTGYDNGIQDVPVEVGVK